MTTTMSRPPRPGPTTPPPTLSRTAQPKAHAKPVRALSPPPAAPSGGVPAKATKRVNHPHLDGEAIKERLLEKLTDLLTKILGKPDLIERSDWRWNRDRSSSLGIRATVAGPKRGFIYDYYTERTYDPIGLIQLHHGPTYPDALQWAADWLGFDGTALSESERSQLKQRHEEENQAAIAARRKSIGIANGYWSRRRGLRGTPAELHLRLRGLWPTECRDVAYCPDAYDPKSNLKPEATRHPALMFAVRAEPGGPVIGIQWVYLEADGRKAHRPLKKKRSHGPLRDGAAILRHDTSGLGIVAVGEGGENMMTVCHHVRRIGVDSTLGKGHLRTYRPRRGVKILIIVADNDSPDSQGRNAGMSSALAAQERLETEGYIVEIICPPTLDEDINDIHLSPRRDWIRTAMLAAIDRGIARLKARDETLVSPDVPPTSPSQDP